MDNEIDKVAKDSDKWFISVKLKNGKILEVPRNRSAESMTAYVNAHRFRNLLTELLEEQIDTKREFLTIKDMKDAADALERCNSMCRKALGEVEEITDSMELEENSDATIDITNFKFKKKIPELINRQEQIEKINNGEDVEE